MGLSTKRGINGTSPIASVDLQRSRFGTHFPRVFACAYSLTENEAAAKEIVAKAFSRAFVHPADLEDDEFVMLLFATVRDMCRSMPRAQGDGDLSSRERELLALVFDARLSRDKIRRLMRTTEEAVSATLLGALRKLRESAAPAGAREFFRPA